MIKLSKRFMLTWLAVCIAGLALCAYIPIKQGIDSYKFKKLTESKIEAMKHDTYLLDRIESMKKE
ncbi:hypothetical protein AAXE64_08380 [Priestia megaterium]